MDEVHIRTRRDHASEVAEDYVEAIAGFIVNKGNCRSVDLAEHFAVTPATVNNTVARLVRDGLVITAPYQPVDLTPKGRKLALKCKERHDVVSAFLIAMGVDAGTAAKCISWIVPTCGRFGVGNSQMNTRPLRRRR